MPSNRIARTIGLNCKSLSLIIVVVFSALVLTPLVPPVSPTTPASIGSSLFTDPNVVSFNFWEVTNGLHSYSFAKNSTQLMTRLADPLGPLNNDFVGSPTEFYDIFYSNWDGSFNLYGDFITVEAVFNSTLPLGGGLNIAEVYANFVLGTSQHATFVASFVALGDNAVPGSVGNAVDGSLGTSTTMGNTVGQTQRLRITLGFPSSPLPPL